jgi:hypothetical protein
MTDGWEAVGDEDKEEQGCLAPKSEEHSPKEGAGSCAGAGDAMATNTL